jgi:hypothetical protein
MATLHHWDLVQAKAKTEDEDKRGSGLWKLTDWGRQFVRKEVTVPKHAFVFNKTLIKHSKDRVNIVTALGKKFSYDELMHTTYRNTK